MKKLLSLIVVILFCFTGTSCKKDYTCVCTNDADGKAAGVDYFSETIKERRKKAQAICEKKNSSSTIAGKSSSYSCSIK